MRRPTAAGLRGWLSLLLMLTLPLQALAAVAPGWLPHVHAAGLQAADGTLAAHAHALHLHPAGLGVHALNAAAPDAAAASADGHACAGHVAADAATHAPADSGPDGGDCGGHWLIVAAALPCSHGLGLAPNRPPRHAGLVTLRPHTFSDPPARPPRG